jgi:hypothetical protein
MLWFFKYFADKLAFSPIQVSADPKSLFFKKNICGQCLYLSYNIQTMHIKSFYKQKHCYVFLKTLYPGGIRTRVFSFLRRMQWCPLRHAARAGPKNLIIQKRALERSYIKDYLGQVGSIMNAKKSVCEEFIASSSAARPNETEPERHGILFLSPQSWPIVFIKSNFAAKVPLMTSLFKLSSSICLWLHM